MVLGWMVNGVGSGTWWSNSFWTGFVPASAAVTAFVSSDDREL